MRSDFSRLARIPVTTISCNSVVCSAGVVEAGVGVVVVPVAVGVFVGVVAVAVAVAVASAVIAAADAAQTDPPQPRQAATAMSHAERTRIGITIPFFRIFFRPCAAKDPPAQVCGPDLKRNKYNFQ
jgi:hypothetical protein